MPDPCREVITSGTPHQITSCPWCGSEIKEKHLKEALNIYDRLQPPASIEHLSRRGTANRFQILAEVAGFSGDRDVALDAIARAVDIGFVDLLWLDHCPLLDSVRASPRFGALRVRLQERANAAYDAFWS